MKNSITIYSFFLFLLGFSGISLVQAQEKKLTKATENYEQLNYVNAQKVYLTVAEKGYQSEELFTKLANSYYFNAQYDQAVKWYESLFNFTEEPEQNLVYLRYSQALKAMGQTEKAMEYYDAFVLRSGSESNAISAMDYMELIQQNSGRYEIEALQATYSENKISFGYVKLGDTLYYATTTNTKSFLNKRSAWDGLSFLSLYTIQLDTLNRAISKPKKLGGNIESKFHESSPVFTADGNTMYFTRSNITYDKKKDNQKLKIYRSKKTDNKWQKAEELSINSDHFSTAHPTLGPDGTKLYFSSDRPGGYGESDLYVSQINTDGSIGEPVNLGSKINTSGKETFPFVSANNELYFSSDGHFGLGGLDVFYVKIQDTGYGNLLNIGEPVNSYADDFAFGIDQQTGRGFISSNRSEVQGQFVYDNIYSFLETSPIIDVYFAQIQGLVTNKQTGLPITGANIVLSDAEGKLYKQVMTDENGQYLVEINKFESYFIKASKESYDTNENVSKPNLENQEINFQLQQNEVALVPGVNLAEVLNIPIIYFDFDKSNIRQDAQVELEKLLAALNQYPNLKIEIRSHTDSRGNDAYNKALSQRRATSTMDYLIAQGIGAERLTAIGMGETALVNNCSNGVPCSETDHQKNRRSEFIIVE
ncbi:OmpA family protein [Xanthomarina sp.]|uniref:OmpA family protein n=1 Tax=Xanthomarina sp. TaxID=1931211 RepID=UPI002CC91697|nr:OmpA family protein [Xanthomarina sp.]HLV37977.1 OmpA family protein [Xanthomarina sp.]